jgi:hypothetical protein
MPDNEMKTNALKPNGFHFLLSGKRSALPRPNNFLFPVKKDGQVRQPPGLQDGKFAYQKCQFG